MRLGSGPGAPAHGYIDAVPGSSASSKYTNPRPVKPTGPVVLTPLALLVSTTRIGFCKVTRPAADVTAAEGVADTSVIDTASTVTTTDNLDRIAATTPFAGERSYPWRARPSGTSSTRRCR